MRVIVSGRLKQRSYETKEGEKRTVFEVEVDEVGPSLRNATAKVVKAARGPGGGGGFGGGGGGGGGAPADDPWSTPCTCGWVLRRAALLEIDAGRGQLGQRRPPTTH